MWVLLSCTSTGLSSTVTMRQVGIRRLTSGQFSPNREDPKKTEHFTLPLLTINASILILLWAHYECAGYTSPQPKGTSSLYRYIEKVHSHAILNRIYCPRLAPYLVGKKKKHLQKSVSTRLLDHIKAQMVKSVMSDRCKRVTYVQKKLHFVKLQV